MEMKGNGVQGTILILDGVSVNRIMLKVQLSAAWYHVVQADGLAGLDELVRRTQPDLIVTALSLPDGDALSIRTTLAGIDGLGSIPIIAITPQNDQAARLRALAAGIDDVLAQPLDDVILQARIRSLIRTRSAAEELRLQGGTSRVPGLAEPLVEFSVPDTLSRIALVTQDATTSTRWRSQLKGVVRHHLITHQLGSVQALMSQPVADAIVVELPETNPGVALRLLADLRARSTTRHAAILAVVSANTPQLAAEALDRGAHDVLQFGFFADELALRLENQLRLKARSDQLRNNVREGLRASILDPMTGLFNRRYAMPRLAGIAQQAAEEGSSFAVMLMDLDHFKRVNDQFGHPAGDAVLVETTRRLRDAMRPQDMIARVGGEEFMIVMPGTDQPKALAAALRVCQAINTTPFHIAGVKTPVQITTSIGVVVAPPPTTASWQPQGGQCDQITKSLISQADRALYAAKGAGRNQVTLIRPAA